MQNLENRLNVKSLNRGTKRQTLEFSSTKVPRSVSAPKQRIEEQRMNQTKQYPPGAILETIPASELQFTVASPNRRIITMTSMSPKQSSNILMKTQMLFPTVLKESSITPQTHKPDSVYKHMPQGDLNASDNPYKRSDMKPFSKHFDIVVSEDAQSLLS